MGNWNINVQGVGCHHNDQTKGMSPEQVACDAEKMAAKFVADLKAAGHQVEGATFTYGGKVDVGAP